MPHFLDILRTCVRKRARRQALLWAACLSLIPLVGGCEERQYHIATLDSYHLAQDAAAMLKDAGISTVSVTLEKQKPAARLYTTSQYLPFARAMLNQTASGSLVVDGFSWNDDVSHVMESSTLIPTRRQEAAKTWHAWREQTLESLRTRLSTSTAGVGPVVQARGSRLHIQLDETGNAGARLELQAPQEASPQTLLSPSDVETMTRFLRDSAQSLPPRFRLNQVSVHLVTPQTLPDHVLKARQELERAKDQKPHVFSGRPAWQYVSIEIVFWAMIFAGLTLIGLSLRAKFRLSLFSRF